MANRLERAIAVFRYMKEKAYGRMREPEGQRIRDIIYLKK